MQLKEYFATENSITKKELADFLGVSPSFMSQMIAGTTAISEERCVLIEKFTDGKVSRKDLRDNWAAIWPELFSKESA